MATITNVSQFNPTQISGCTFWVDAADPTTVTQSGGTVSGVKDKSGYGYNLTGGSGFTYPNNTFNGAYPSFYNVNPNTSAVIGRNSSLNVAQPITVFTVGIQAAYAANGCALFDGYNSSARATLFSSTTSPGYATIYAGNSVTTTTFLTNPFINCTIFNGTNSFSYLNGIVFLSSVNPSTQGLTSGITVGNFYSGSISWYGHICELIIYNTALTTAQQQQVEGYLAWKWNLQANLQVSFIPTQLSGVSLWLDASDSSTVVLSGSNVTQWNDKSGQANNAVSVPVGSYNVTSVPTYSPSNLAFFGSAMVITTLSPLPTVTTGFIVATLGSITGPAQLISGGTYPPSSTYGGRDFSEVAVNNLVTGDGTHATFLSTSNSVYTVNTLGLFEYVDTGALAGLSHYSYGTLLGTATGTTTFTAGNTTTYIGARSAIVGSSFTRFFVNGSISEIIIFNFALNTSQRQQIEGYLAWKWGFQAKLPSTHPYYYINPILTHPYYYNPILQNLVLQNQLLNPSVNINTSIFIPTQISGCALWLDAADASTVVQSGGSVSQWKDKSGAGNNATQTTPSSQPKYVNNAIYMSSSNYRLNLTNLGLLTNIPYASMFIAYNLLSTSTNAGRMKVFFADGSVSGYDRLSIFVYSSSAGTPNSYTGILANPADNSSITFVDGTTNTTVGVNTLINAEVNYSSGAITDYINGVSYKTGTMANNSNTANTNSVNIMIGSPYSSSTAINVYIYEVVLFLTPLPTAQRQQIEGYLAWKWGFQGSLPSSHPYYYNQALPNLVLQAQLLNPIICIASGFSPKQFSGLSLWLDAADITTVTQSGGTVSQWKDKSGGGNNATAYNSPTYSTPNINVTNGSYFSGSLNIAAGKLVTTAFCVAITPATYIQNNRLLSANDSVGNDYGSPYGFDYSSTGTGGFISYRDAGNFITTKPANNTNVLTTTVYNSNGVFTISLYGNYPNGSSSYYATNTNSATTNALTQYIIGTNLNGTTNGFQYWNGYINEIIIFNRTLSQSEYQQIEGYLAWKWGLQANLPALHPYVLFPPN